MKGRMFTLVNAEDPEDVFGWGVELDEPKTKAVVMMPDPGSPQVSLGVHNSAEAALRNWQILGPLDLVWHG